LIRPFYNRLDVELPFLFYSVPLDNPAGPTTVFTDRFWDDREHWLPPSVGVVPNSMRPYWGPIPGPQVGPLQGDPNQWIAGFNYDDWIAGRLGGTCIPLQMPTVKVKIGQVQGVGVQGVVKGSIDQRQTVGLWPIRFLQVDQAQTVFELGTRALVEQQQQLLDIDQVGDLDQVQTVEGPSNPSGTFCANLGITPFGTYGVAVPLPGDGTCSCAVLANNWPVSQVASCTWQSNSLSFCGSTNNHRWQLGVAVGAIPTVQFRRITPGSLRARWVGTSAWDGVSAIFLPLDSAASSADCVWPAWVTVYPIS